jgi:hypothetical protein
MADKLSIYNMALGHLRERRLASLTEAREPRRVLDDFWNQVVSECLEEGLWNFMVRAVQADSSATVTPAFGWKYAFAIPADWVRTVLISTVETFTPPLLDYAEETGYWYANWTPLFARYVSSDPLYGQNLGSWTANFTKYVSYQLAQYACGRITGSEDLLAGPEGITKRLHHAKIKAKSNDAMNQPPGQIPTGTWVRSRRGFLRGVPLPGGTQYDD